MNDFAITEKWRIERDGYSAVMRVDRNKAKYKDIPFASLSEFQKRKFENLIKLSEPHERIKILYS